MLYNIIGIEMVESFVQEIVEKEILIVDVVNYSTEEMNVNSIVATVQEIGIQESSESIEVNTNNDNLQLWVAN